MIAHQDLTGVSNCYMFKSRLQEYAQKESFPTPVYETIKEGPSHEPCFRSTVIVDNVRYDSLPGFFNRKAAEQSAAEVALLELAKSGRVNESIINPVHETGLCKNLLQEYAQKMNYAIPSYVCRQIEKSGKKASFSCTVEIGGIQYIGAAASSKKEAEIKAARTALLAIQSNPNGAEAKPNDSRPLTVLPCKKKSAESDTKTKKTEKPLKPRKGRFKKNFSRKKFARDKVDQATSNLEHSLPLQVVFPGRLEANQDGHGGEHVESQLNQHEQVPTAEINNSQNEQAPALNFKVSDQGFSEMEIVSSVQIKNGEHVVSQLNQHEQVPVTGINDSQNEQAPALNIKVSDQGFSEMDTVSSVQIKNGEHVSQLNRHEQVPTTEINDSQNEQAPALNIKVSYQGFSEMEIVSSVQIKDGEHVGSQLNQNEEVPVTEVNNSQNEQAPVLNIKLSDQGFSEMEIFSSVQIKDGEHVGSQLNQHEEVPVTEINNFQNEQGAVLNFKVSDQGFSDMEISSSVQNNDDEHVGSQLNQHKEVSVTEINNSQKDQAPVLNFKASDQGFSDLEIFSSVEMDDIISLATDVNKDSGVAQVGQIEAAEVPLVVMGEKSCSENGAVGSNQSDGRKVVEFENVQRVGEQVQAAHELYGSVDYIPL